MIDNFLTILKNEKNYTYVLYNQYYNVFVLINRPYHDCCQLLSDVFETYFPSIFYSIKILVLELKIAISNKSVETIVSPRILFFLRSFISINPQTRITFNSFWL